MADAEAPEISVVIPVRNGAATLAAQLNALVAAGADDSRCEVVLADNGSNDRTVAIARGFEGTLDIRVVDASRSTGINVARNEGVGASRGAWILLCDADDEVDVRWLHEMRQAFESGHQLVGGIIDYRRLNTPDEQAWRGAQSSRITNHLGFLPFAHGANIGFSREAYDGIDGFDESFMSGGDDVDFCWRIQLAGFDIHEVPAAIVHYRLRSTMLGLWHQFRDYGRSEALLYRRFRDRGMPRRARLRALRDPWWLATRLPYLASRRRRGAWIRIAAQMTGRISGAIRHRVLWL